MLPLRMLGLLMLLLLHGADSTSCPPELNPLILNPPIGEYGTEVVVNCTSTYWHHKGMTLLAENISIIKNDPHYKIYKPMALTDWNTKVECKIQLNDSIECTKELEITAYKTPNVVLTIKKIDKARYQLQCDVSNFAPAQNHTVTWYKDGEILTTNSSAGLTKESENQFFTKEVNIQGEGKVVQFRCEAQPDFGPYTPLGAVISDTHNVSALYAPELSTNYSEDISVSKGENVTLTCHIEGDPPPNFQWTVDGKDLAKNTSQLKITDINNSTTYTCTATNDLGNKSMEIYVNVTEVTTGAAPVTMTTLKAQAEQGCPLILTPSEIIVKFGDPVEVNCTANTNISGSGWEVSAGSAHRLDATTLTWKVENLKTWDIKPSCYANLKDRSQCEVGLDITLYQTPDIVSVSGVDPGPMIEGREYQLKCDVNNVARVQLKVKWYHGNKTVFTDDIQNINTTPTNVSSYYTVTPERGDNGSEFRCEAELQLGPKGPEFIPPVTSQPFNAVVYYKPLFQAIPSHYTVAEKNFTMSDLPYETDGNPPPDVKWYYQGTPINLNESLKRTDTGSYTAEASNVIGSITTSVFITVEYRPSLTCKEQYEVVENSELKIPCELDGSPSPSITWFKHEKEISPSRWTKHDSGMYSLKATNTHGAVERKFNLQVLYAPEFLDENTTSKITLGQNVTFNCSAKGYPPPVSKWTDTRSTNLIVTTGERYSTITIMEATSANAGVYQCVATNKVGTVTRFVILEIGETRPFPSWMVPFVIATVLLVSIILVLVLWLRCKNRGEYSFVASNDASHIPMTTQSTEGNA
ncbi:hemicentin-1-like [Melanotaenia boesemani]|uniref:hemicentin-1-like n=1 Tax=Melanotaenia boesemani TaxID=1250792 RepID=UPI001C03D3A0|nr:hemicentin-1-like [Melanotaenia boesemani]